MRAIGSWGRDFEDATGLDVRALWMGAQLPKAFAFAWLSFQNKCCTRQQPRRPDIVGIVASLLAFNPSSSLHTHTGKNLSVVGQKHTLPWPCQQLFASRPSRAVPNWTGKADAPPKFLCRLLLPIGKRIPCISRFGFASSLTVLAGVSSVVPSRADVCVSLFEFSLSHLPGNAFNYPRASYADCAYLEQIFTR